VDKAGTVVLECASMDPIPSLAFFFAFFFYPSQLADGTG
jgi:hypothetical protein